MRMYQPTYHVYILTQAHPHKATTAASGRLSVSPVEGMLTMYRIRRTSTMHAAVPFSSGRRRRLAILTRHRGGS